MAKRIIILLTAIAFSCGAYAQSVVSTHHRTEFANAPSASPTLVRVYQERQILTCFMDDDPASGNPVRYHFAITEHEHHGVPSVHFPLPVELQVNDMEILDSMCHFCGTVQRGDGTTRGILGRFSVEEMLRGGGVCNVDTLSIETTSTLTRLDVSHFNNENDTLYLIGVVGRFALTNLSAFVMAGNYNNYLTGAPWHYREFNPPHKAGEFSDVVVTPSACHVSTTYKGGADTIGVVTVPAVDLNVTGTGYTGEIQLFSLPPNFSFATTFNRVILDMDPTNNHIQVLTAMKHEMGFYGIYSKYFLPLTSAPGFHLVATDSLLMLREAVILPRAGMSYILTEQWKKPVVRESGFHDFVFRLDLSLSTVFYDHYADVPGTRLNSIDRLNDSMFVTAGHFTETDACKHEYLSQHNATFTDTDPSCMRIDRMLVNYYDHPDSRVVKQYLSLQPIKNKGWKRLWEEKGNGETEVKCIKYREKQPSTNQENR